MSIFSKKNKPAWKIARNEIKRRFSFLQSEYGFSKFRTKWIKDEYYISTLKGSIEFSALICYNSPNIDSITIINHSESYEPIFKNNQWTSTNHYSIEDLDKTGEIRLLPHTKPNSIELYINECAELLKKNPNALNGNNTDLKQ